MRQLPSNQSDQDHETVIILPEASPESYPQLGDMVVVRPQVFMLNETGPVNPPQTILFYDGSDLAEEIYLELERSGVDFALSPLSSSDMQPFVHSRRVSIDLVSIEKIRLFAHLEVESTAETDRMLAERILKPMSENSRLVSAKIQTKLENELNERARLRAHSRALWLEHRDRD